MTSFLSKWLCDLVKQKYSIELTIIFDNKRIVVPYKYWSQYFEVRKQTLAVPRSVTTQTSIAVFPRMTVTFVGVVGSMYGAKVLEVVGDFIVVVVIRW